MTPVFYAVLLRDRAYTVDAATVARLHTAIRQRKPGSMVTLPHACCEHRGSVQIALGDILKIVCLGKLQSPPWARWLKDAPPAPPAGVIPLERYRGRPNGQ